MVQTPIWDFFKKTTTETGDVRAVCMVCEKSLRFHNTSVMVRHLRYLHPNAYENYRNEYIQGRIGVGYDIRAGILGLPLAPPKKSRTKKSDKKTTDAKKVGFKTEQVKKLILLKAKTEKEESCVITEKDLEQLGQRNIKILNISNKGTISDIMGDQIIEDIKKGKSSMNMPKFEGQEEPESVDLSSGEQQQFPLKGGRQYKVVHVPAEYLEYLKGSGSEIVEETAETAKEGTEVFQILDERETVAEVTEHSDNEFLQIWEQFSNQQGVLVCSVDPNSRRQANVVVDEGSSEENAGQVEFIIAN